VLIPEFQEKKMRFSLLFPLAIALFLGSSASALELRRTFPVAEIAQAPSVVRFLIFDGPDEIQPIEIVEFVRGQYWLKEQGDQVVIGADFLQDIAPQGLWMETELDGQIKGERIALEAAASGVTFANGNNLVMTGNTITGLAMPADPGNGPDAANRAYVLANQGQYLVGTTKGDMQYWDGSAWVLIPAPVGDKDMLSIFEGVPEWTDITRYAIGDTGPAGGIVFHITDDRTHGLEAAPTDQSTSARWGCVGSIIVGASGVAIGTGQVNTLAIVNACGQKNIAAKLADEYGQNGFADYYLPSRDELKLMFNRKFVLNMGPEAYWSSSQAGGDTAYMVEFVDGLSLTIIKNTTFRVRVIRNF
jgi:hypothetical protein